MQQLVFARGRACWQVVGHPEGAQWASHGGKRFRARQGQGKRETARMAAARDKFYGGGCPAAHMRRTRLTCAPRHSRLPAIQFLLFQPAPCDSRLASSNTYSPYSVQSSYLHGSSNTDEGDEQGRLPLLHHTSTMEAMPSNIHFGKREEKGRHGLKIHADRQAGTCPTTYQSAWLG